jgi:hypothetical protein
MLRTQLRGRSLTRTVCLSKIKLAPRSKDGCCSELRLRLVDNSG